MSLYSQEKQNEFIARIRTLLVRKPDLSVRELRDLLEAHPTSPIHLDKNYVNRLVNKIRKERTVRLNSYTVNTVLAKFEEETEDIKQRLWFIITDAGEKEPELDKDGKPTGGWKWAREPASIGEKIKAIRELRASSVALFDKMFDAGVFERQLGKLKTEDKLSPEDEEQLRKALEYALNPNHNGGDGANPNPA